jgi:hypothetical protein
MSQEQIARSLRSVCEHALGGGRVVADTCDNSLAVFDAPAWSSAHTDALRAKYGGVRVDVEQSRHSASGFVVLVTPTPRCRAPSLFFLLAAFLCIFGVVGFLWNVLHVHYEGVHNIDIFSCASPSETAAKAPGPELHDTGDSRAMGAGAPSANWKPLGAGFF